MVQSPEKKRRRQLHKQQRRKLRRRYSLLDGLPFPDAPVLLAMEPYFCVQDSFDLVYGHGIKSLVIARQLNEFAAVLNEDLGEPERLPAPLLEIPSPSLLRKRQVRFPISLFADDSLPRRLYELKVRSAQVSRAAGNWIAVRPPHLTFLTGDQRIVGRLRRSEYLARASERRIEVFSLTYRPLFYYRVSENPCPVPS
jgi:hypothetical protein